MSNTDKSAPELLPCAHCKAKATVERATSGVCWVAIFRHESLCFWAAWLATRVQVITERGFAAWNARADTRAVPADSAETLRQALQSIQHRCRSVVTNKESSQAVLDIDKIVRKALNTEIHGYEGGGESK